MTTPAQKITTPAQSEQDIFDFKLDQQKNGRADETIRTRIQVLRQVAKLCDINSPEIIKIWLSDPKNEHQFTKPCTWSNKTKTKFIDSYSAYLQYKQILWTPPKYTINEKLPFIPTETEIDMLIAGTGKVLSTVLQTIKETGIRIGELTQLTPLDLDTERKTLKITPEKGSNPRILPISDKLITMIKNLPKDPRAKYKTLFQPHKDTLRDYLCTQRKALAQRFNNPRLAKIGFHTLRHWKGTMEYHNTKDIVHVKTVLGHKSITSTMIYINLDSALFLQTDENFVCKVAHNEQEETELIEANFTHVNNRGELAFYKKRK
jgi:integrase